MTQRSSARSCSRRSCCALKLQCGTVLLNTTVDTVASGGKHGELSSRCALHVVESAQILDFIEVGIIGLNAWLFLQETAVRSEWSIVALIVQ